MRKGFTLVELIAVMVVLSILAGIAAPRFFDTASDARRAQFEGVVGAVQEATRSAQMAYETGVNTPDLPPLNEHGALENLGDTTADDMELFDGVLENPIRRAGQGEIGFRFDPRYNQYGFMLYYWDHDGDGQFRFTRPVGDSYLIYITRQIGTYPPGSFFIYESPEW